MPERQRNFNAPRIKNPPDNSYLTPNAAAIDKFPTDFFRSSNHPRFHHQWRQNI